jgi:type III pantothenate kinase
VEENFSKNLNISFSNIHKFTFATAKAIVMKLVIDVGNSFVKLAVFDGHEMIELKKTADFSVADVAGLFEKYKLISGAILSSVRENTDELTSFLARKTTFILLDAKTPLPFKNLYATPETLGRDRIAAVAGAQGLFPGKPVLVIDAGTSITYDLLTAGGEYLGGGISPGLQMRFDALHTLTSKLPLVKPSLGKEVELIGNSTGSAILTGVQNGVLQEVDGIIGRYEADFSGLKTVICGGDNKYFDKYLKNNIFAAPNLVLQGLMKILQFNENS